MSLFFHRNPLKATTPQKFDGKGCTTDGQALKICGDLRQTRALLLDLLSSPTANLADVVTAYNSYVSLLQGLLHAADERGGESKLRYFFVFRWTNSALPDLSPVEQQDALFELIHISVNLALWYMKHAAYLAGKSEPSVEESKEVHRCLRLAGGVLKEMHANHTGRLLTEALKASDLDSRILVAYISQCTAEAQEVTIQRAVELNHAASLISALANETSKMFDNAHTSLGELNDGLVPKWKKYLQLKSALYLSEAYCYCGENLLAQDKCGEAIKALHESEKHYESASHLCKEYARAKGPGLTLRPEELPFFLTLKLRISRVLEKCDRENGMIYHQKVPVVVPALEIKATFGLVSPEDFSLPPVHPSWTDSTYKAFDLSKVKREGKFFGLL